MSLKQIHGLDHTVLLCTRMEETRRFYETTLGLPVEIDTPTWVSFRVGGTLLSLRPRGATPVGDDGPVAPGSVGVQLAFRVPPPAVDSCHAELTAKGVTIARGPTDIESWRHRTLFFHDPENNLIEIYAEI
jgi:glyoxylase I family protein